MSSGLRIAEVAGRAGVSPATMRYYERIGVLPPAARNSSGYRVYDDDVVARLAFITRAKQLGCTLDEVADLAVAWDGGECGPVQDRLRRLVADKLAEAEHEIVELTTLTDELRIAADSLERHRPLGPCDDTCGCVADPAVQRLVLTTKAAVHAENVLVACTLSASAMQQRLAAWKRLLDSEQIQRTSIVAGVHVTLARGVDVAEVTQLVLAEQECCEFLSFAITVDRRGIGLDVTAPADALEAVEALIGTTS